MAKKSRRVRKKGRKVRLSETQLSGPETVSASDGSVVSAKAAEAKTELTEEYRYVAADLKRVGIIAGALLVIAIVLALVLV